MSNTRLYNIWCRMISRCTNINDKNYITYGGRGIIVCDEWKNSFLSFYKWSIVNNYSCLLSIDRINNDGNYEPSNCRFATKSIQAQNTKILQSNNTSGYRGVRFRKDRNRYVSIITVDNIRKYIGYFNTKIEAATAFNRYVVENNLNHSLNIIIE